MGFFDTLKKGAELAKAGLDEADNMMKKKMSRMSDDKLMQLELNSNKSNKYVREELEKRNLL